MQSFLWTCLFNQKTTGGKTMKEDCNYLSCNKAASKTWALVPLCQKHYDRISYETALFYRKADKNLTYENRKEYHKISHLIPWSRKD
jgi:hypothetical protein